MGSVLFGAPPTFCLLPIEPREPFSWLFFCFISPNVPILRACLICSIINN